MIQRIQSLFLLIASIGFWLLFKFPFASSDKSVSPFFDDQLFNISDHTVLLALTILGGLLTLVSIFLFNNRALQLRINYLSLIFAFFLAGVAFWLIYSNGKELGDAVNIEDQTGLYFPIVSFFLIILANYFISKDSKLVKSMDRLR